MTANPRRKYCMGRAKRYQAPLEGCFMWLHAPVEFGDAPDLPVTECMAGPFFSLPFFKGNVTPHDEVDLGQQSSGDMHQFVWLQVPFPP